MTSIPLRTLVIRADPDFERARKREPYYLFTKRIFRGDNATSGPYAKRP